MTFGLRQGEQMRAYRLGCRPDIPELEVGRSLVLVRLVDATVPDIEDITLTEKHEPYGLQFMMKLDDEGHWGWHPVDDQTHDEIADYLLTIIKSDATQDTLQLGDWCWLHIFPEADGHGVDG